MEQGEVVNRVGLFPSELFAMKINGKLSYANIQFQNANGKKHQFVGYYRDDRRPSQQIKSFQSLLFGYVEVVAEVVGVVVVE